MYRRQSGTSREELAEVGGNLRGGGLARGTGRIEFKPMKDCAYRLIPLAREQGQVAVCKPGFPVPESIRGTVLPEGALLLIYIFPAKYSSVVM